MKNRINLLLPKEEKIVDKIIHFSLSYLRYILVITLIVVNGVFFYRLRIDQQIIDLKEELEMKNEIVEVARPIVNEASRISIKIIESGKILVTQNSVYEALIYVSTVFPEKCSLESLKLSEGTVTFSGTCDTAAILRSFYAKLQKQKKFASTELKYIRRVPEGFAFQFNLKQFTL